MSNPLRRLLFHILNPLSKNLDFATVYNSHVPLLHYYCLKLCQIYILSHLEKKCSDSKLVWRVEHGICCFFMQIRK